MEISEKRFARYKKHCLSWIEKLHLGNWIIKFQHDDGKPEEEALSWIMMNSESMIAVIALATDWTDCVPNDAAIDECAYHEVLHLLLKPLMDLACDRSATEEQLNKAEHDVIRYLIVSQFGASRIDE